MSITANYIGSLAFAEFFSSFANSSTTYDAYTVDAGNRIYTLSSYAFANDTGSAVQCKLYYYDSVAAVEYLVWTGSIAANSTGPDLPKPVRLGPNDVVRARANANVSLHMNFLVQLENSPT